jgi:hypothetical protein
MMMTGTEKLEIFLEDYKRLIADPAGNIPACAKLEELESWLHSKGSEFRPGILAMQDIIDSSWFYPGHVLEIVHVLYALMDWENSGSDPKCHPGRVAGKRVERC